MIRRVLPIALAGVLLGALLPGCDPGAGGLVRQTDGNFPQPRRFDAVGAATLRIEDLDLVGGYVMRYFVLPGDNLRVTGLAAELEDDVLLRERLFSDPDEFPLRCNRGHLAEPADGTVNAAGDVDFSPGEISVDVLTSAERGPGGTCPGARVLPLHGTNGRPASGRHAPSANRNGLMTALTLDINGTSRSGALVLDGRYSNRPPVARIASVAPGLYDFSDWGCPPVEAQELDGVWTWPEPPLIHGNRPEGLEVIFSSVSHDPDGVGGSISTSNAPPRVDLVSEQWAHWEDANYRHLGNAQQLPAMTFVKGPLHRVLLTVTDRSGARSQAECRFVVVD